MEKVSKIILRDSADSQFDDLIEFEEEIDLELIKKVVEEVKQQEDYSNEDVYKALERLGKYTLLWIGQCEIIEY